MCAPTPFGSKATYCTSTADTGLRRTAFASPSRFCPRPRGTHFWAGRSACSGISKKAIAECRKAIALDPDYGNPYNDIGAYLIELGRPHEAIPWLEKAISAKRYCCYQFAHFNLGRVHLVEGNPDAARRSFEQALRHDPDYLAARKALDYLDAEFGKPL